MHGDRRVAALPMRNLGTTRDIAALVDLMTLFRDHVPVVTSTTKR